MALKAENEEGWILIVEDNRGDVDLIREALEQHQVQLPVLALSDGAQACKFFDEIDALGNAFPSLVILDLNLPRKTGREVLNRIRESPVLGRAPVVVLSSSDTVSDREESLRLGARLYISKPSSLDEFLRIGGVLKDLILVPYRFGQTD